ARPPAGPGHQEAAGAQGGGGAAAPAGAPRGGEAGGRRAGPPAAGPPREGLVRMRTRRHPHPLAWLAVASAVVTLGMAAVAGPVCAAVEVEARLSTTTVEPGGVTSLLVTVTD